MEEIEDIETHSMDKEDRSVLSHAIKTWSVAHKSTTDPTITTTNATTSTSTNTTTNTTTKATTNAAVDDLEAESLPPASVAQASFQPSRCRSISSDSAPETPPAVLSKDPHEADSLEGSQHDSTHSRRQMRPYLRKHTNLTAKTASRNQQPPVPSPKRRMNERDASVFEAALHVEEVDDETRSAAHTSRPSSSAAKKSPQMMPLSHSTIPGLRNSPQLEHVLSDEALNELAADDGLASPDVELAGSSVEVTCVDFSPERLESEQIYSSKQQTLVGGRPSWAKVRWLNVDGIHIPFVKKVCSQYRIHPIVMSDITDFSNRPKVEVNESEGQVFVIAKMITMNETTFEIEQEQVCFLLDSENETLITFQEGKPGDVWTEVRKKLAKSTTKVRSSGADYLMYALVEALFRNCYPILENMYSTLEEIEAKMVERATVTLNTRVYNIKREVTMIRRNLWPMREVLTRISGEEVPSDLISQPTKRFFKTILDETLQINDLSDSCMEMASSMNSMYSDIQNQKVNQAMLILTVISSIFIPLTFISSMYGMNVQGIDELKWRFGYMYLWLLLIVITSLIAFTFWRKKLLNFN